MQHEILKYMKTQYGALTNEAGCFVLMILRVLNLFATLKAKVNDIGT